MKTRFILLAAVVLGGIGVVAARADDAEEARRIAESLIQQGTVEFLSDRELEFDDETLSGTVKAVEPEERVKIEITDFLFVPGRVTVTFNVESRFRFAGKVTVEETQLDVEGTADVGAQIDLVADYRDENGELFIDSRITDMDEFEVDVVELQPADLPGGKELVEKLAKQSIEKHRSEERRVG